MAKLTQEELDRVKNGISRLSVGDLGFNVDAGEVRINNIPLKEFLEGVAWLGESSYRLQTLVTLAHKYGVELTDETDLFRCDHEFTQAIEPRIMPSGMTWPRFEDGEPFKFGDEVSLNNSCGKVNSVKFYPNGNKSIKAVDEDGNWGFVLIGKGELLKRPEPKQDTLQDVIDDISKSKSEYWGCEKVDDCENCPSLINGRYPSAFYGVTFCGNAQILDIKRRLEAIQERMGGEE